MKALFLDVDGVLNYAGCKHLYKGKLRGIDPDLAAMVRRIVRDTGCVIVLSSTWRMSKEDRAYVRKRVGAIHDITPSLLSGMRGNEIDIWLEGQPDVDRYAILDDDTDFFAYHPLFKTDWHTGLTPEITQEVIEYLNAA